MPCKLRYSLTALAVIALVAAFASSAAQAQFKNATGATKGTDIRPWTTTHGSTALYLIGPTTDSAALDQLRETDAMTTTPIPHA